MTQIFLQDGQIVKKTTKSVSGLFNLNKFIKSLLSYFNVALYDPCCENPQNPVSFTLRDGLMEFNGTTWIPIVGSSTIYLPAAQNNITAGTGGAIPITNYLTTINTDAGGDTFTLADGSVVGQMKKILLVIDGTGDGVVTPAHLLGGTTITFNDANDYVILTFNGTAWVVIENSGCVIA